MTIRDRVPQSIILDQLAEEAAELAQAALKLKRTMSRDNPTTVTAAEASDRLLEEIADVIVCMNQLEGLDWRVIDTICGQKVLRWEQRLGIRRATDALQGFTTGKRPELH